MYFDPLSAWLVALIANGIAIVDEKSRGGTIAEYHRERIEQNNRSLNADIRKIKEKYGLTLAEMAYEQIERHIKIIKKSYSFEAANGQIVIDLDNQEYIIAVLEECAKQFSKYESVEKYRKKAEWYKNAAVEARQRKELYAKELKETHIREAKQQEKDQTISIIGLVAGLIILVTFVILFFS